MTTGTVVLASGNRGKLREFRDLLAQRRLKVIPQSDLEIAEPPETGLTFVENALIKARNASRIAGLPAIADDSGLEVDALNGAPGIYSARFAGDSASDADNNRKLLASLADVPEEKRTARFQCVLVFLRHHQDPTPLICQGTWEGRITDAPRGNQGFGYDPLFYVRERNCTSAELPQEEKNTLSHRARAMRQLLDRLGEAHP